MRKSEGGEMKRLIVVCAVAATMFVEGMVVPAQADAVVTFVGSVRVPASMLRSVGSNTRPTVELTVVPDSQYMDAALAAEEAIQIQSIASTEATPGFSLDLDMATLSPDFVADDGHVEVMIAARLGSRVTTWELPATAGDGTQTVPTLDMATAEIPEARSSIAKRYALEGPPPCGYVIWGSINGPYSVKLMDVTSTPAITGRGSYYNGSSTSTTLGFLTGTSGHWSVGGTITESRSTGTGFDVPAQNRRIYGLWKYRERQMVCFADQNVPYSYYGYGSTVSITRPHLTNCGSVYPVGGNYTHGSTKNQTFTQGVTVYGFSLSSQEGYTSSSTIKFHFTAKGRVCGSSSTLGESSPRVEAHTV
jgi:hypothetical protein